MSKALLTVSVLAAFIVGGFFVYKDQISKQRGCAVDDGAASQSTDGNCCAGSSCKIDGDDSECGSNCKACGSGSCPVGDESNCADGSCPGSGDKGDEASEDDPGESSDDQDRDTVVCLPCGCIQSPIASECVVCQACAAKSE